MLNDLKNSDRRRWLRERLHMYRSLPEYLLDSVGVVFERVLNPAEAKRRSAALPVDASAQEDEGFPSYWLNGIAIALGTLLVGWLIALGLRRPFRMDEIYLILWTAGTGALALIANKVNIRAFLSTFHDALLERMPREADVAHLGEWLESNFGVWKPLLSGLVAGPVLAYFLYESWLANHDEARFHAGVFAVVLLACIQSVWVAYYLYPFYVSFPSRLNRYEFDLYTNDPSSSEVVGRLSRLLTFILYVTLGFIVQLTVGVTIVGVLTETTPLAGFLFSIFVWAPTVILYAAGQYHLSDLISRAKWRILNEVQAKIEAVSRQTDAAGKIDLDQLDKLMNYHDRIKATPNSALNFRSSLNFLNSLLLPILAFVFTNLNVVQEMFAGIFGNTPAPP